MVGVEIQILVANWPVPTYAKPGDAGADLRTTQDVVLQPGERKIVGTGVAVAIPDGYVGFVHPRSGLAAKQGLSIVNSPGTIDSGYRGEIMVALINHDPNETIKLSRGDRIAQLVIQEFIAANFMVVEQLPESDRGSDGYGSTGSK